MYAGSYGLTAADGRAQPVRSAGSQAGAVTWPVRAGLVPPLADGFAARPETIPGLEAALVPGAAVALVPGQAAASRPDGPGSSGKTQLVAGLAGSLWQSRTVDLLAWVNAASRASVLSGYAQAAAQLGLDHGRDAEAVAARFLAWLAGTARPWLVVLDDLRQAADLEGLWRAGSAGRVLITAADAAAVPGEHGALVCAVPAFSIREALGYLSGRLTTDPDQRGGAIDLAGALGCEPAALAQASAVIISSGIRCREYRDHFIQQARPAAGGEPSAAAGLTWTVSAAHAEQLAPGAGIWPLLALVALLDGHGIPGAVLTAPATCQYLAEGAVRPPDPQRAWSALLVLERAGLVAVDAASAPSAVWVSPALQAAARAVAPPELLDRAARAAADALVQAWPGGSPPVRAGRAAAVMRRQPAASWRGCAVGQRPLSPAAAGSRAEPRRRRADRPRSHLVAGAGRRQRSAPRPGPSGHPGGGRPAGRRAAGRRPAGRGGDLVRVAASQL